MDQHDELRKLNEDLYWTIEEGNFVLESDITEFFTNVHKWINLCREILESNEPMPKDIYIILHSQMYSILINKYAELLREKILSGI